MARVLCLSDIHSDFAAFDPAVLPEADLCVIAGDVTEHGHSHPRAHAHEMREARAWLAELGKRMPTFVIPGNHDIRVTNRDFDGISGVTPIQDRRAECLGLSIHGVSLTPTYLHPRLARHFDHMTADPAQEDAAYDFEPVDIVVSHAPPYGYLDRMRDKESPRFGPHIGSEALTRYITAHQPKLVVCGHLHNDTGQARIGETLVLNVAKSYRVVDI